MGINVEIPREDLVERLIKFMASLKNKPKQGQKLHTWVALGGKPKARQNAAKDAKKK